MASSDVRKELDCSICLNIYTNPITLKCGHNFCRDCIERVLDTQEDSGVYRCPECREEFQERPELPRNITLCNIVKNFLSTEPEQKEVEIFCTYCIHSPVPAVKSCLHCEASLCDDHLKLHSKSPQHVLSDLTNPLESRKCPVHKKILEYYCSEDSAYLCGSCRLHGDHQEHLLETLEEASGKRKENLTNALQKLLKKREEMEQSIESLKKYKRKVQDSASGVTKRVDTLFRDIRRQLDTLERKILNEISRKAEKDSFPASDLIQELEAQKEELSRRMSHYEKMCNMKDPLSVLQESHICDIEDGDDEDKESHDKVLHGGGEMDVSGISHTLYTGLSSILTGVNGGIYIPEPADILLDEDTAHNYLQVSEDRKAVRKVDRNLNHPDTPERFQVYRKLVYDSLHKTSNWTDMIFPQVLTNQSFSSGRHYWDVDVGGSLTWSIGMCYSSIGRKDDWSQIGNNRISWGLYRDANCLFTKYDHQIEICDITSIHRVRVYLDYKAGQLSFYELGVPIRHLHTFTVTFTQPLLAILYVGEGCIKIVGKK